MELSVYRDKIELFLRSETPAATTSKVLLALIALGGVVVLAGVAPGLSVLLKKKKKSGKFSQSQIRSAYYNAQRKGLIHVRQRRDGALRVSLTKKGKNFVKKFSLEAITIKKQKKWDGKWRVVVYDVPTNRNKDRSAFRFHLEDLGFYKLQGSVWVYPYPCEEELLFIAKTLYIDRYIEILTVSRLLNEKKLLTHFNVKK